MGQRVQLFKQVVPKASRFWVLEKRAGRERWEAEERELALLMGGALVGPLLDPPVDEAEYRRVFTAVGHDGADAIVVGDELENITNFKLIVELAEKNGLPAIYPLKFYVDAGGLISYGPDHSELGRGLARISDQILKGTKPGDIPLLQPTKFELGEKA